MCYTRAYMAFCAAVIGDWVSVKRCIDGVQVTARDLEVQLSGPLGLLVTYITGLYHQGVGELDIALEIYEDCMVDFDNKKGTHMSQTDQVEHDIAILIALSRLWVLQERRWQDSSKNKALITSLEAHCLSHRNKDIQTAFHLVVATIKTEPPATLREVKDHLSLALSGAQKTMNGQFMAIVLIFMCSRFFAGVVGQQSEKSAMAAVAKAKINGSPLWMSVADGLLAQCYELQGKKTEAQATFENARALAQKVLPDI